ncbi:hypothetical protein V6N11_048604 [Hibiscus sabdariffa]|uniref:RNase H type-1 domain-containing protein n=1 Tax=Hibiscus sabdariffa TaxID=183260 RepID=A0ABR2PVQ1_9ROSI
MLGGSLHDLTRELGGGGRSLQDLLSLNTSLCFCEGFALAVDNNWAQVIVERDSFSVVTRLRSMLTDLSTTATHLASTRAALADHAGFRVHFIGQEANRG